MNAGGTPGAGSPRPAGAAGGGPGAAEPAPPAVAPLSTGQHRLWFLAAMDPDSAAYHMPQVARLRGPLDLPALTAALHDVVRRHSILRTRFPVRDGEPVAEVVEHWTPPVDLIDLTAGGGTAQAREQRAQQVVAARTAAPFDLATEVPLRVTVLRLGADDHILSLVLHHILADDWSLGVLFRELSTGYAQRRAGRAAEPRPLPPQYADHVRAGRERAAGRAEEALRHWTGELAGAEPLALVTDRPRPPVPSRAADWVAYPLGGDVHDAVRRLCRAGRTTPFMTMLAGYLALLGWYTGQRDICVGTPVSGRDRTDLEPVIGFFLTTMVVRGDLTGDPTFRDLLGRVKARTIAGYGQADVPLEELMSRLGVRRDPSRNPLFDTMFMVHRTQETQLTLAGLAVRPFDPGHHEAKFDLLVEVQTAAVGASAAGSGNGGPDGTRTGADGPDGATGGWQVLASYRMDLFDAETVTALLRRFAALLTLAADAPDEPLSHLYGKLAATEPEGSVGTCAAARTNTDQTGGAPAGSGPAGGGLAGGTGPAATVLDLLAAGAAADPDTPAVDAPDGTHSRADLHRRAGHLAGLLRRHGAGPDRLVAVCLPPGARLVTTLLAVLRAGAAYLPLDPDYPSRRLRFMLADSGASLLITADGVTRWWEPAGPPVVHLDQVEWPAAEPASVDSPPPGPAPDPDRLAYAIYTSGSTGQPKAVGVPHAALAARLRWMRDTYRIGPGDRVLQFASASFDTFGEEVYPTLAGGATLVVPPSRAELPDFLASPAGQRLTVLDLPTAYWHELVADPAAVAWPPELRLLILGGQQVRADALGRWFDTVGDRVEVWNTYGPTEATIIATAARMTPADAHGHPPIGVPIGDTCAHVHDEHGMPLPPGVPGELYLGGAGLARGYLGRPELTAQRFVWSGGERRYRTGDRVRRRADGTLDYLGRVDDQLKVRGYRVEPGEVEAALTAHPAVRHATVGTDSDGRLVAHLVPAGMSTVDAPALHAHLADLLPVYLHPDVYVTVDALPLTPHGKVDRAALPPAPAGRDRNGPASSAAPQTDAQRLVAAIWSEVLGVDSIGVEDDFFDLGGHSLLAIRVAARLRASVGIEVPLRTIFHDTTVASLADAVEEILLTEVEALDEDEAQRLLDG